MRPIDESLQSYIFRRVLLSGSTDFFSLISRDGMWLTHVELNASQKNYFIHDEEKLLLSMIKSNYAAVVEVDFFHNPFYYLELFKYVFKNHNNVSGMQQFSNFKRSYKKVSFCNLCMAESIFSYGFGYFKEEWSNGEMCTIHNVPIYYLSMASARKTIVSISEILLGRIPNTALQYPAKDTRRGNSLLAGVFHRPISPCLFRLIHRKLCHIIKSYNSKSPFYDEKLDRYMYSSYKELFYASRVYKEADAYVINDIINKLYKLKYFPVIEAFDDLYEELEVFNGVEQSASCSEWMLVPKIRNCRTCTHSNKVCGLSDKIAIFSSISKHIGNKKNYCDTALQNSTAWSFEPPSLISSGEYSVVDDFWILKESSYNYDLHRL
ncbi:hypothetical protein ORI98_17015 [Shewanella sp. ULN5]|uniref:hypothetical protein n=1 Tax=Shewanella sp. ULN5 TaxID=2994678 RepID=UPI00273DC43D|nr:hypothetical protein [Shewanella sp. ULN5]MDP5148144.1 hypothetical protein [Shewanella sp. ULN5]